MKITEISKMLDKLGHSKEAIIQIIDMAIEKELEKFNPKIDSIRFKIDMLIWAFTVVVIGTFLKMLLGL